MYFHFKGDNIEGNMKKTSIKPEMALIRCILYIRSTAPAAYVVVVLFFLLFLFLFFRFFFFFFFQDWKTWFFECVSSSIVQTQAGRQAGFSFWHETGPPRSAFHHIYSPQKNCPRDHFCLTIWNHNWSNAARRYALMNNLSPNGRMIPCFFLNNSLFSGSSSPCNVVGMIKRKPNPSEVIDMACCVW